MSGAIPPPGSHRPWAGRAVTNARTWLATRTPWPVPCARCGADVHSNWWHLGHRLDRQAHPHLTWNPDNWQIEHPRCSTSAGATQGNKRRTRNSQQPARTNSSVRKALMNGKRVMPKGNARVSMQGSREGRTSLSFVSGLGRVEPVTLSDSPRSPGDSDGLPRFFSEPHPEAVRSRGDEFVAHAEERRGGPLRWFQWVCAQRRYEVRADGSWCWQLVFHTTARQQGKSVDLAEDAAWYCSQAAGPELILHTAHRVKTSLKVQADLWSWAEARPGFDVRRLLGDSHIVWPGGSDWATVAMESAYGQRPHRLLADEAWALDPVKFWNSLFPALGDRVNPQVLFFSTANPEERGLVSDLRRDPMVCRMEWGAAEGEDQGDEDVWRASSAFWGPGRLALMRTASTRPGFAEEWLNVWPGGDGAWRWLPVGLTDAARGPVGWPAGDVGVAGVESRWNPSQVGAPARWAVAVAWMQGGRMLARVERVDTLAQVVGLVGDRRVHAHQSVIDQLAAIGRGWRCEPVNTTGQRSSGEVLAQLVRARGLTVDGVDDVTWAGVRVFPSDGGEVVDGRRSPVDVAGVKALGYAVAAASRAVYSGPVLIA